MLRGKPAVVGGLLVEAKGSSGLKGSEPFDRYVRNLDTRARDSHDRQLQPWHRDAQPPGLRTSQSAIVSVASGKREKAYDAE
jgi:hypothetical protein